MEKRDAEKKETRNLKRQKLSAEAEESSKVVDKSGSGIEISQRKKMVSIGECDDIEVL